MVLLTPQRIICHSRIMITMRLRQTANCFCCRFCIATSHLLYHCDLEVFPHGRRHLMEAQLPETMVGGNLRNGRCGRCLSRQGAVDQMHPA